jgi:uncharacterized integral membrane protein
MLTNICSNKIPLLLGLSSIKAPRVIGVGFALLLAWRRAPLIIIILGAALMTALLRRE